MSLKVYHIEGREYLQAETMQLILRHVLKCPKKGTFNGKISSLHKERDRQTETERQERDGQAGREADRHKKTHRYTQEAMQNNKKPSTHFNRVLAESNMTGFLHLNLLVTTVILISTRQWWDLNIGNKWLF